MHENIFPDPRACFVYIELARLSIVFSAILSNNTNANQVYGRACIYKFCIIPVTYHLVLLWLLRWFYTTFTVIVALWQNGPIRKSIAYLPHLTIISKAQITGIRLTEPFEALDSLLAVLT